MNQFVHVEYNSASSAIICKFVNLTDSLKSCTVLYGRHNEIPDRSTGQSSTLNSITLKVDSNYLEYYYVTASSSNVTVSVEGLNINTGDIDGIIFTISITFWYLYYRR